MTRSRLPAPTRHAASPAPPARARSEQGHDAPGARRSRRAPPAQIPQQQVQRQPGGRRGRRRHRGRRRARPPHIAWCGGGSGAKLARSAWCPLTCQDQHLPADGLIQLAGIHQAETGDSANCLLGQHVLPRLPSSAAMADGLAIDKDAEGDEDNPLQFKETAEEVRHGGCTAPACACHARPCSPRAACPCAPHCEQPLGDQRSAPRRSGCAPRCSCAR